MIRYWVTLSQLVVYWLCMGKVLDSCANFVWDYTWKIPTIGSPRIESRSQEQHFVSKSLSTVIPHKVLRIANTSTLFRTAWLWLLFCIILRNKVQSLSLGTVIAQSLIFRTEKLPCTSRLLFYLINRRQIFDLYFFYNTISFFHFSLNFSFFSLLLQNHLINHT